MLEVTYKSDKHNAQSFSNTQTTKKAVLEEVQLTKADWRLNE